MEQWALLIFTISMQAAIGGTLILALFYKNLKASSNDIIKTYKLPLIVISVISLIGLGASFAHLGTPTNAFNTILGFGSSWMSREIVFTGAFIGLICLTTVLVIFQKKINNILLIAAAVIGLIDVYCMAAIYANTFISSWRHANTFLSFYGTTFVLGTVLAVVFIIPSIENKDQVQSFIKKSFYIALLGIGVQLIGVSMQSAASSELLQIGATMSAVNYESTLAIRWIVEIVGILILAYLALSSSKKVTYSFVYAALLAILIGEGMSRYVFYAIG